MTLQILCTILYLGLMVLLGIDTYGSHETSGKLLFFSDSRWVGAMGLALLVVLRIRYTKLFHPLVIKINNLLVLPASLITSLALSTWDAVTPLNYVFSVLRIQYQQLLVIAVFCLVVAVLSQTNKWFKRHYSKLFLSSSLFIVGLMCLIYTWPLEIFARLAGENRLIEDSQFMVLLIGSLIAGILSRKLWLDHNKPMGVFFGLTSFAFFMIAGDEISWGQHFLGAATPDFFMQFNKQEEITIHNLEVVHHGVRWVYILIGTYGSFAWLAKPLIGKKLQTYARFFIPPAFLVLYFLLPLIYNLYSMFYENFYGILAEYIELLLYLGMTLTLLHLLCVQKFGKKRLSS